MLKEIPLEWIIGLIAAIAAAVGFKFKLIQAKKEGQNEVISAKKDLDLTKLMEFNEKSNAIRSQNIGVKDCVPNNWDDINKLREAGKTSLQAIAGAGVCTEGPKSKK